MPPYRTITSPEEPLTIKQDCINYSYIVNISDYVTVINT